jgi:hypothetical protein
MIRILLWIIHWSITIGLLIGVVGCITWLLGQNREPGVMIRICLWLIHWSIIGGLLLSVVGCIMWALGQNL